MFRGAAMTRRRRLQYILYIYIYIYILYSPHPLQGEQGVLNHLSESQNLKVQAGPPPAAGPCPNFAQSSSKSINFLISQNKRKPTETGLQRADSGHPKFVKTHSKSLKLQVEVSFGMVLGKSLGTRGLGEAQRTKPRDENSNPIEPARSKHSFHFSHKTLKCHRKRFRVYSVWIPCGDFGHPNVLKCLLWGVLEE